VRSRDRLVDTLIWAALVLAALLALVVASQKRAQAYTCSVPNTFLTGQNADANQVNANFSALIQCLNNLDATNIGSAGIYASNFDPLTRLQATFGGGQNYTFPASIKPLGLTPGASGGCVQLDFNGNLVFTAVDGSNHGRPCLGSGTVSVANGGSGVAGGWTTGDQFCFNGSVFSQACAVLTVRATAPILVNSTPPPTPTPGPTATPAPPLTAMVERQTTIIRVQQCPNIITPAGCSTDIYPITFWSSLIAYRFYQSTDGGNTWTYNYEITSGDSGQSPDPIPTPDCTQGSGVTYSWCPGGTWTPSAPPGLTGLDFSAPFGAPGQTPSPIPSVTPSPTPTPVPTPTPTPIPPYEAQLSLAAPLAMQYGGTGVTGSAWPASAPPFGDCLGASAANGTVSWIPCLPALDNNGTACQGGAHSGTPYCIGIAPAHYVWTGIPISFSSCAAVTTATQAACSSVALTIPAYPNTALAARLPVLSTLHAAQVADGATHIYQLADTSGTTAVDTGSVPSNGSYPCIAAGACTLNASPLTADQAAAVSFSNSVVNPGAQLPFEDPPSSSAFTIEAVVKPINNVNGGNGSNADIVANGSGAQLGFEFQVQPSANAPGSTVGFIVRNTGGTNFGTGDPGFVNGQVYHVVGVFTGTAIKYYVNGSLFASTAFTGTYNPGGHPHMLIGTNPNGNAANRCGCVIEAVAIYGTALTGAQVSAHYAAAFSGQGIPTIGTCTVSPEDTQYPMRYVAQWQPPNVTVSVWNGTTAAISSAYTATLGLSCEGSWTAAGY
jgi:hypothetical protein